MTPPAAPGDGAVRVLAPLLAVAMLAGCSGHRPRSGERSGAGPGELAFDLEGARQQLLARSARSPGFDGEFRVRGRHAGKRFRVRGLAVIDSGGQLLLEAAGARPFVFACDGEEVRVLLSREREWLGLPASAASIEALIGLSLAPDELGAVLSGVGAPPGRLREAVAEGARRLRLADGWLELAVDAGGAARVVAGEVRGVGFRIDPGGTALEFRVPARKLELLVTLIGGPPAGSPAPGPGRFRPVPPAGFREAFLAAGGEPLLLPGEE